jgi:lysozyme family protein
MLYRWEAYNGFRSRTLHNINTPYLWSFSNHYSKGKFVADNVWDGNAVSKQCGAAVMLKVAVDGGIAHLPA